MNLQRNRRNTILLQKMLTIYITTKEKQKRGKALVNVNMKIKVNVSMVKHVIILTQTGLAWSIQRKGIVLISPGADLDTQKTLASHENKTEDASLKKSVISDIQRGRSKSFLF